MHLFISAHAWLVCRDWLVEGLRLYRSMDGSEKASTRDFMMCLPSADLRSFRTTMMRYPNAMVFSRTLMTELLSQRKNQFGNYETLMEAASSSFWSEHSERVTIVSWAASCEVDRETRVPLG